MQNKTFIKNLRNIYSQIIVKTINYNFETEIFLWLTYELLCCLPYVTRSMKQIANNQINKYAITRERNQCKMLTIVSTEQSISKTKKWHQIQKATAVFLFHSSITSYNI